jgi:mannose-1-phosphate guanylyltransferase
MILAAGLGTRLRPLTGTVAKPAIPFVNRPLIHYCLDWLSENGVNEVVINLHHSAESVLSVVKQRSWPLKIHFSHESELLGTAGGLKKAERYFQGETFVMVNSDGLYEIDLADPVSFHKACGALATMVLRGKPSDDAYGTVTVDQQGRILDIAGKGETRRQDRGHTFTGLHVFEPEILSWIPPKRFSEINREIYPRLMREGRSVQGFVTDTFWTEIGTPQTYLKGHRDFLVRRGIEVCSETRFSNGVHLVPPVFIGKGCRAGQGTRIGPSAILGQNCHIGQGTVIEDSVIWAEGVIGSDVRIRNTILGYDTRVDSRTRLDCVVVCGSESNRFSW